MSKTDKTLAILCLLLFVSFTRASRPLPSSHQDSLPQQLLSDDGLNVASSEGCEGVGEEECLMRRTLVAHLDYIYTQGKKKP